MRMQKKQFRIGALAQELKIEKFVIRFWEKEFCIKSHRSIGGQRYYTHEDLETFKAIKELLYNKKFTIAGAKEVLQDKIPAIVGSTRTTLSHCEEFHLSKQDLLTLRTKLHEFKHLLASLD